MNNKKSTISILDIVLKNMLISNKRNPLPMDMLMYPERCYIHNSVLVWPINFTLLVKILTEVAIKYFGTNLVIFLREK